MKTALVICLLLLSFHASAEENRKFDRSIVKSLARSISIIRNSTFDSPQVLRVFFYGQSITSPKWINRAVENLKTKYPYVYFEVKNAAIGGFDSSRLERSVERDLADFYPDLIVFHAYGDHLAYERIIKLMRQRTAADIILETDHVVQSVEPVCRTGLRLTIYQPPGCTGNIWLRQKHWDDFMSGAFLPMLAKKYGLAIEPRRQLWNEHLKRKKLEPAELLADDIHPNDDGWLLASDIFTNWFDAVVAAWDGERSDFVTEFSLPAPFLKDFEFIGSRVEIVSTQPLDGFVAATIDGKVSKNLDGCWTTSRASALPNVPDWPALSHITIDPAIHSEEEWLATLKKTDASDEKYEYKVEGSLGYDGTGRSDKDFVSLSGRVRLASSDWMIKPAKKLTGKSLPEGFQVRWHRRYVCGDAKVSDGINVHYNTRHVVAAGLANARHKMDLSILPNRPNSELKLLVYRPPLE